MMKKKKKKKKKKAEARMYKYKAIVTEVYDGDTITVDIDLGFGIWMRGQKVRLLGINAPEVRGPEREQGIRAAQFLLSLVRDREVVLDSYKLSGHKGKYGRWLATIYVDDVDINQRMIDEGYAEPY